MVESQIQLEPPAVRGRCSPEGLPSQWVRVLLGRLPDGNSACCWGRTDHCRRRGTRLPSFGRTIGATYCVTCHPFPSLRPSIGPHGTSKSSPDEVPSQVLDTRAGAKPQHPDFAGEQTHPLATGDQRRSVVGRGRLLFGEVSREAAAPRRRLLPSPSGCPDFGVVVPDLTLHPPSITAVKILPGAGALAADAGTRSIPKGLGRWPSRGQVRRQQCRGLLSQSAWRILTAGLGSFLPSDALEVPCSG